MNRLLVVGLALVAGCGPRFETPQAQRVVSLVPSITEIIYALGAETLLVGNTNQCDYPQEARFVYKVGDFATPDFERIVALKPDLVFVTLPIHRAIAEKLAELKIRFHDSRPESLEAVFAEITLVGTLLSRKAQAQELVARLKRRLASLPAFSDTPKVYVEIASAPLMTVGGRSFVDGLIQRAGGRNVFHDAVLDYPVIDPEMVAKANPDVIIIAHPDVKAAEVARRLGWENISAVRNNRVFDDIDDDLLLRPGPRVIDGIILLAQRLHHQE